MAAEFKIGRLRFTWAGVWAPNTTYIKDAIVSYQGKTYVCLIANISSSTNFYNDLYYVTNTGASTPLWNLIVDGKTFTGLWTTGTTYSLGNIAIFGGQLYYCTTNHTSTAFASQTSYWSKYTQFANWHITWTTGTVYGVGDVVKYGGIIYQCIANHTSAATAGLGLEANQSAWTVFYSGINYTGTWSSGTRYKLNDLAKEGANIYQCTTYNSDTTFTPANWTLWLPGLEYAPSNPWSTGATYQVGDTVEYGGYTYISKTTNNTANTPSTSSSNWTLFTQGFNFQGEWSTATSYLVGHMVRRHSRLYAATSNNTAQDPAAFSVTTTYTAAGSSGTTLIVGAGTGIVSGMNVIGVGFTSGQTVVSVSGTTVILSAAPDSTATLVNNQTLNFVGVNYAYWTLLIPGTSWTNTWINNTFYTVGDLVVWQNTTYVCVQSHTASISSGTGPINRPDLDTTNAYWTFYVPHARKNAMNTQGDLEYYTSTTNTYTALPIGASQYVLRDTAKVPTWTKINTVSNVYYVSSTTGQDIPTYGTTWDQPFKSIAYACNFVSNGTQFPNTVALLLANKNWILAEMIQYTNYQINNVSAPLHAQFTGYNLNTVKATRDAGYIIDALAYDIGRGGNSQTVAAALAFFAYGQSNIFYSTTVAADVPFYLPMLTYLTSLINSAITQVAPAANYQVLNSVTPVIYQTTGLSPAELNVQTGASGANSAAMLMGYITTALTTQSTYALPPQNTGITITIYVKTGTYPEALPIVVPENTAIVGDELRGVIVEPAISITTTATASSSSTNLFTVASVTNMADQQPIMFANPSIYAVIGTSYAGFGGITTGQKYYIVGSTINALTNQVGITGTTGTYTYQTAVAITSSGSGATFTVTPTSAGTYSVSISYAGTGYAVNDKLRMPGGNLGAPIVAATALVQGTVYTIVSVGTTDFTLVGATANIIGTSFTATAVAGLGTGTVNLSVNDVNITVNTVVSGGIATIGTTGSTIVQLSMFTGGNMTVYAGDAIKDMFRLRNGTGLRNMTLVGLLGTLGASDAYLIQRPTGGSYACLDPGIGVNDTTAWIFRRSPYVQNVTAFGNGCTALKIDGNLHNGGNKSIVCNDFTHIVNDGIGIWCTGPSALCEAVSVFSYYGYSGYFAEGGGRIRATNGNSSYGVYGVIAEGYDSTETPLTGTIFNQSSQVQATVQSAYGSSAQLLRLNYSNAGSAYTTTTTNLLNYSNNFLGANWSTDGNIVFSKNTIALTGNTEAWTLQGLTSGPDGSYAYQNVAVPAAGATYTGISAVNVSGSGLGATFNVTVTSTAYIVTVNGGGSGYVSGNQLFIAGGQLGGVNNVNDCIITVFSLSGSAILTVTNTGTVPANSALNYTLSVYVKQGTASSVDLYGIFSGSSTVTSALNYNFTTGKLTASNAAGGFLPTQYGAISRAITTTGSTVGWYRIWMTINDTTGLNTNLQYRLYPRGYNGTALQYTFFYGAQLELSKSTYTPSFYLEVASTSKYTAYANYNITGSGTGVVTIGDEIRSSGIFQTYVTTDSTGITGGAGYLTASNNAQSGNTQYVQLSSSDTNTNANYTGMRVFINSGTGAGQYGYISYFDSRTTGLTTKFAYVLKESFTSLQITSTNSGTGLFTLSSGNVSTLYLNQPVQFIPTYFTTVVTSTNLSQTVVTATTGGTINTVTVASTAGLAVNMGITFTAGAGSTFSNIIGNYTYFVYAIINSTTLQISSSFAGTVYSLNTATGSMIMNYIANTNYLQATTTNMVVNYPIQFTGTALGGVTDSTVYYINDIIDSSNFTIASTLVQVTVTATTAGTNVLTTGSTGSLISLTPIVFTNTVFDNVVDSTKYYISSIVNSTQFTIASTLISVSMTATANGTNLVTVGSTTGFVANQPINFIGTTWETNIVSGTVYYVLAINNSTTFTISQTPGGGAVLMNGGNGLMIARTCPTAFVLSGTTGSMVGSSTNTVKTLTLSVTGSMTATFSTSLFGNPVIGTTYYVQSIPNPIGSTFAVSASTGTVSGTSTSATPIGLLTNTGSMNVAAVGWDHINPGTTIQSALDNSSVYYIEPRVSYSAPVFGQFIFTSAIALTSGINWSAMAYGAGYWIALPNSGQTAAGSSDGTTWTNITLPSSQPWSSIAYGNGYWVAVSGSNVIPSTIAVVSKANGAGWRTSTLPASVYWSSVVYGNGIFVALASNTTNAAYSTNYGTSWASATLPSNSNWSGIAYGNGIFVAIATGGTAAAWSTNGITWTASTLPSNTTWSSITFGQQTFVAVSSTSAVPVYSQDGKTWSSANIVVTATKIIYAQGVFVALNANTTSAYTSEDILQWNQQTVASALYGACSFGFNSSNNFGQIVTLSGQSSGSTIAAGCKTKGRAAVTSGVITSISEWEPGSGYVTAAGAYALATPSVIFTDPNVTTNVQVAPRLSQGVLSSPTFFNKGAGYNSNSTVVLVTGNGYADQYQTGLQIIVNNLLRLPSPGDNLTIAGVNQIYKITSSYVVYGTVTPNIEANINVSPAVSTANATANGTAISIRTKYSQARLTNHDFLYIGSGDLVASQYPATSNALAVPSNQTIEANYGRVFYTSTDQDGNFKVGSLFGVQQATGIVTLSASQFGLTGLTTLSLGGISVGGSSVIISQFSTDSTFSSNSDTVIPTQKAIKTYLTSRLSQGGANTFTGQLTAGTVVIGGPNFIKSTVPNGSTGSNIKMVNKVYIQGVSGAMTVDGNMAALAFFARANFHRGNA
jgi:hypothetical protein